MWETNKGTTKYDKRTVACEDETVKCDEGKKKGNTKCDKRTVTCDVRTAQYKNVIVKCEEKKKGKPSNVTKELSHVMLKLHNVRIKSSNVRKKIKEPMNVTKELSHVMLELHNVRMWPWNMRKK